MSASGAVITSGVRVGGMPLATDAPAELMVVFEATIPDFEGQDFYEDARAWYAAHARRFADALRQHAPGGFVDALLGELLHRKASVFRVRDPFQAGGRG